MQDEAATPGKMWGTGGVWVLSLIVLACLAGWLGYRRVRDVDTRRDASRQFGVVVHAVERASTVLRDTRTYRWVTRFSEADLTQVLATGYVSNVEHVQEGLLVTFGGPRVSAYLRGRHAFFVPAMHNGDVHWACRAPDVPRVVLADGCQ